MYQTITFSDFHDRFKAMRPDNFSYDGLKALYDYLEDYEESAGEPMELDVIAICCDFTEYEDMEEFQEDHGDEYETIEDVERETMVIGIPGSSGFIVQDF